MNAVTPESRDAVRAFVARQLEGGAETRPVGSCTSKSPCYETEGVALRVHALKHIEHLGEGRVRAGAGVILSDLIAFLNRHRLALPTVGEWSGQTLAGAISTASHGGSYGYGTLCASVTEVVLLDGRGQIRTFARGDAGFDHILPSFGTTGVLLEIELRCEPHFALSMGRNSLRLDDYLERLVHNPDDTEFRASLWLPAADYVLDYAARRVDAVPNGFQREREVRFNVPAMVLDWISRKNPARSLSPKLPVERVLPPRHYLGPYEQILAPLTGTAEEILAKRKRNKTPPEGEFAVPMDRAEAFIRALDDLFRERGIYPDRPVGLRPGGADSGTLVATPEPAVWVSMFIDPKNPFMKVLPGMLREFGARPHWGKCVFHDADDIPGLYDGWNDFAAFRAELDPEGIYLNAFARRFGLG